ncbi:A disintegrin and metalloproteinase with thrombospondin motifs adt-1-like isoform X2 [Anopheles darlingi]|nr:A disintegrin and metalloproteinase with thrombospondin motifs adt-1-like isoform X2 [Anopheles darlingi]
MFLDKHERLLLFGDYDMDNFMIVNVRRRKRESRSFSGNRFVQFNIDSLDNFFFLNLKKAEFLVDDSFAFIEHYDNATLLLDNSFAHVMKFKDCFFLNELAAFDLCDGNIRGLMHSTKSNIIIHPLPERFGTGAHIIVNRKHVQNKTHKSSVSSSRGSLLGLNEMEQIQRAAEHRSKRQLVNAPKIPDDFHVEIAIFIDKDLYRHMMKNYPKNTEASLIRFILTMINGVQLLYNHPSLGYTINFILKRLEILHNEPKGLRRSSDIDIYLHSFCNWQKKLNPLSDADPVHFDHAVILTGLDLFVVSKNGKKSNQVVGLAPVGGMCTTSSSCTINEGKHFESVFVVSHEIGHNLGMRHDTSENNCDPSLYIMSPTLGSGKISWSTCSRNYLNAFLKTSQATCLFDRGRFESSLDHTKEGKLPGERFDADQQCQLKYGKDSGRSKMQDIRDICQDLHCQRDRYIWNSHPALEGTSCGDFKWCRTGVCVSKIGSLSKQSERITGFKTIDKKTFIDGLKRTRLRQDLSKTISIYPTWSAWSDPSECVSGCLYGESGRLKDGSTGFRQYTRRCLDKRKRCFGASRMYETCIPKQCFNIVRTTVPEFSNQICGRAKEFDADIIGHGLQKFSRDPEDACKVFCYTKSGITKSKSWIYPDGTTCKIQNGYPDHAYYCVGGRCEAFSCANVSNNYYQLHSTLCPDTNHMDISVNSLQQGNGRKQTDVDFLDNNHSRKLRTGGTTHYGFIDDRNVTAESNLFHLVNQYSRRYGATKDYIRLSDAPRRNHNWETKSGCHFSCIEQSKGVQTVITQDGEMTNIQLCNMNTIACDLVITVHEFASKLCKHYQQKVRHLSGNGMQISSTIDDPNRSCRVACQDVSISHRFYLVNGIQGHFPTGSRCSHKRYNRYCVKGKCLQFDDDGFPVNSSSRLQFGQIQRHETWIASLSSTSTKAPIMEPVEISQTIIDNGSMN